MRSVIRALRARRLLLHNCWLCGSSEGERGWEEEAEGNSPENFHLGLGSSEGGKFPGASLLDNVLLFKSLHQTLRTKPEFSVIVSSTQHEVSRTNTWIWSRWRLRNWYGFLFKKKPAFFKKKKKTHPVLFVRVHEKEIFYCIDLDFLKVLIIKERKQFARL